MNTRDSDNPFAVEDTIAADSVIGHGEVAPLQADTPMLPDSITVPLDSLMPDTALTAVLPDSVVVVERDSLAVDTNAPKPRFVKEFVDLENAVDFSAKDSLVFFGKNTAFMYGDSKVKYGTISLDADEIHMDMRDNNVYAVGRPDSTGEIIGDPVFKDPSGEYNAKTMKYNFKSKRDISPMW